MSKNKDDDYDYHHEHDKLFKAFFQVKETMIDYITNFLPENLLKYIVPEDLELDNTTYVNSKLFSFQSDVVYRTKLKVNGKTLVIAILLEHKSSPMKLIYLQLLLYICAILQHDVEAKNKEYTFVLPIIVYQGKKTWKHRPFSSLFKNLPKEFHRYIPTFDYHLTNLEGIPKEVIENIKGKSSLKSLFLAYKFLKDKDYVSENFEEFFKTLDKTNELSILFPLFVAYMMRNSELSDEEFEVKLKKFNNSKLKSKIMSTYDSIVLKAETRVIEKVILKALKRNKLTLQEIAEDNDVSFEYVLKIKKEHNL